MKTYLTGWSITPEEQNCFRSGRGTIEHILTIVTVAETRLLLGLDSFAAFIDFRKAYDSIQHSLLWQKPQQIAMPLKILRILQCLYSGLSSSVRVNEWPTNSFSVTQGHLQGCILSPALFNIFSNDLPPKRYFGDTLCGAYFMLMTWSF